MRQPLTSTKITPDALEVLQQIALQTGEKQYATLTRLLTREWERLERVKRQKEKCHAS